MQVRPNQHRSSRPDKELGPFESGCEWFSLLSCSVGFSKSSGSCARASVAVFLAPTDLTIVMWPGLSLCKLPPSRWCGNRARQVHHARAFPAHSKNPTRCPLEPHSPSLPCGTSAFDWRTLGRQPLAFAQPQCRSRQCRSVSAADVFSNLTVARRLATAISQYVDRIRETVSFPKHTINRLSKGACLGEDEPQHYAFILVAKDLQSCRLISFLTHVGTAGEIVECCWVREPSGTRLAQ